MLYRVALATLLLASTPASAQSASDQPPSDQPPADQIVRWGKLATLAPLCGLRDQAWAFDLRRAELQSATGSQRFDDDSLRAAPGSKQAAAALSYAETEALESFAEVSPERACLAVSGNTDLLDADEIVQAFRAQRDHQSGS